jgi:hypothetical protein
VSFCVCLWLWSVAEECGARVLQSDVRPAGQWPVTNRNRNRGWRGRNAHGGYVPVHSNCIYSTSYKQYPTVRTRERPPVRVPWAIYENRLTSAHLGLDPALPARLREKLEASQGE